MLNRYLFGNWKIMASLMVAGFVYRTLTGTKKSGKSSLSDRKGEGYEDESTLTASLQDMVREPGRSGSIAR